MGSPIEFPTVFVDDFIFFEANHERCPHDAAVVFERVAGLRAALQTFRETALLPATTEPDALPDVDGVVA
jgi:hypothetical protein